MRRLITAMAVFLLLSGCANKGKKARENTMELWQGKEIQLLTNLPCRILGKDTVVNGLFDTPVKVVFYVDSVGCSPCKLQLEVWDGFIHSTDPLHERVSFLFYFQPKAVEALDLILIQSAFKYPVFYDRKGEFGRINKIQGQETIPVFLLDTNNRVVFSGFPINILNDREIFMTTIDSMLK